MTMSRSPLILLVVLIASSSLTVDAQQKNRDRNFDDFRGQQFCATRLRGPSGTCCANRIDECSVPIAGNLIANSKHYKEFIWVSFLQELCVTVISSAMNTSTPTAVLTTRTFAKAFLMSLVKLSTNDAQSEVKGFSSNRSKKWKSTAICGNSNSTKFLVFHLKFIFYQQMPYRRWSRLWSRSLHDRRWDDRWHQPRRKLVRMESSQLHRILRSQTERRFDVPVGNIWAARSSEIHDSIDEPTWNTAEGILQRSHFQCSWSGLVWVSWQRFIVCLGHWRSPKF